MPFGREIVAKFVRAQNQHQAQAVGQTDREWGRLANQINAGMQRAGPRCGHERQRKEQKMEQQLAARLPPMGQLIR